MNPLQQFYFDEGTREAVKAFMISHLEDMTVKKVFNGESVVGILEAKELVNGSFSKLEEIYKIRKDVEPDNND